MQITAWNCQSLFLVPCNVTYLNGDNTIVDVYDVYYMYLGMHIISLKCVQYIQIYTYMLSIDGTVLIMCQCVCSCDVAFSSWLHTFMNISNDYAIHVRIIANYGCIGATIYHTTYLLLIMLKSVFCTYGVNWFIFMQVFTNSLYWIKVYLLFLLSMSSSLFVIVSRCYCFGYNIWRIIPLHQINF